ncbi:putative GTPase activating protein for Arf-domain-containing protein [Nemania sp. FL0916]|nr:putative GTPase activating protein for Arf-domain-containing protein [Nemania sp. FL0916]
MRCAAIHRKLGTHISKVKSMSMDSWTNDQVESMKRVGNAASNKTYNPQNKRPPVPVDADEADSAMERFIRSKYAQPSSRTPTSGPTRHNTGSSDEDTPPPLPPKTGTRFFKSATLPFRSKKDPHSPRESVSPQYGLSSRDDHLRNKPSKVFGASVHQDSLEATAQKLTQLRDMGFTDDKRNAMILKGVSGNLEKTVEALVRLGEGNGTISPGLATIRDPLSTSLTPKPTKPVTNGLSKPSPPLPVEAPSSLSNDPWEIQPAPPQSSQSTGTLPNKNPFYNNNPFGAPGQQPREYNLNQSMQTLTLGSPQPPLFPHHTGGAPAPQPVSQPTYSQSMTPPMPQMQNFASMAFNNHQTYPQPSQPSPQQGYNPFLQAPVTPQQQQSLSLNTSPYQYQGSLTNNPFTRSPTGMASPMLNQIPEQSQQNVYTSPQTPYSANPFMAMGQPQLSSPHQQQQQHQQQWFQQTQQQAQPAQPAQPTYPTQQANRDAIMALYRYAQPAPTSAPAAGQGTSSPFETNPPAAAQPQAQAQAQSQSQSYAQLSPPMGTKNPFLNSTAAPIAPAFAPTNQVSSGARSRESMMLGMEMAWNNGRHSPDAFASLSARSG